MFYRYLYVLRMFSIDDFTTYNLLLLGDKLKLAILIYRSAEADLKILWVFNLLLLHYPYTSAC